MLEVYVDRGDGEPRDGERAYCLNDGVITRRAAAGMVSLAAMRQDRELAHYTGDGAIVATPVGSTAYSMAAGGPVLSPRLEALVLTPLASHTLTLRPLVVPVRDGIEIVVEDSGGEPSCSVQVDGQVNWLVAEGE